MSRKPRSVPRARASTHGVIRTAFLSLCAIAIAAGIAHAQTTVWVDNQSATCSSAGPGTEALPYCTIGAAMAANKGPGVTIMVKPGIYREQVTVPAAGLDGSPFVFRAAAPGVVIDGSDDFANTGLWAPSLGTSFVAASVTWTPKQVFVDGARLAATTLTPDVMPSGTFRWVSGEGLYLNLGGDNPGSHATLVGHRNFGFNIFSKSFVTFDGFAISHTEDRGINMQNPCSDLVVSNNSVSFAGSYGIQTVNGQRILIEHNTVSDCAFHGIGLTAGASACIVRGNDSFRNAFPTSRQANGIFLFGAPSNTLSANRLHENQDTGLQFGSGSNNCVSTNNVSYRNGDHGYDHLGATGTIHVNDVAYGNFMDGFSIEGASPGSQLYNCISTDNGLTTNEFDLWVDATSSVGFVSDHNLFWNSTAQAPIKFVSTVYPTLLGYQAASLLDAHSLQADPRFSNPAAADFTLLTGSPAIDAATSAVTGWPATDAAGAARVDDWRVADTGEGPVTYADLGAFEFLDVPADQAPVVLSPVKVTVAKGGTVSFTVSASDPDGDAISSLVMVPLKLPANSGATFVVNATNTGGTFTWNVGKATGSYRVSFIASNALADTSITQISIGGRTRIAEPSDPEGGIQRPVLALSPGYPNPSAGRVDFALDLPEDASVEMGVYDMQGRLVWSDARACGAGRVRLAWDGLASNQRRAGVGLYLVRVRVGGEQFVRRVIRL